VPEWGVVEKLTPQRRRAMTRDALLDAARSVFARRGFEGASLDEIAEAAGFTRGAIYKNFEGKEELFFAVFDRQLALNLGAFRTQSSALDQYDAHNADDVADAWRKALAPDVEAYTLYLEFLLYALRHPEMRPRLVEHQRKAVEMTTNFIETYARENGVEFRIPAAKIAGIMDAATEGFSKALMFDPDGDNLYGEFLALVLPLFLTDAKRD
jgi:AcrR family transcriptional regulator